ncbi:MAG TPA: ATP-binding protein [Candidatus Obscuribacterales bacterium]
MFASRGERFLSRDDSLLVAQGRRAARRLLIDVRTLSPRAIIGVGMLLAFFVFVLLDLVERLAAPGLSEPVTRTVHLARGFVATTGGMVFVWWIMNRKEKELLRLRDQFSEQLELRTSELTRAGQALEQEKGRLDAILSSMGDGVLEIGETGIIHSINPRAEEILGVHGCEIIGQEASVLAQRFRNGNRPDSVSVSEAVLYKKSVQDSEAIFQRPDGKEVTIVWTAEPIRSNGNRLGAVITLADVTERARMEAELRHQREDFISALKHKLKTPVLASRRTVSLLLEGAFGELGEAQENILKLLLDNNEKLNSLVDNLVEVYRYQNGIKELDIRRQLLSPIIVDIVDKFAPVAKARKICLSVAPGTGDVHLECDTGEITTLLEQLIQNGVEHARTTVRLIVENGAEHIVLRIEDDGRGIEAEDISRLFGRFYEVSANGRHPATTGTGLCLCHQIARAHGGVITCESVPGAGTTFKVVLPLSQGK